MNKDIVRQAVTVAATAAVILINALANILPFNGQYTSEISDRFEVYFTPAAYVFTIWSLIYLGLIAFSIYQTLPDQRQNEALRAIAPWYWLSTAANIAWIFLWHYERFGLTVLAMFVLLVSLILIYLRLDIGRAVVDLNTRWLLHLPFSIYLGWITVATIANVTVLLWWIGWKGFGIAPETWTAIVLGMAVLVAAAVTVTRADIAYGLVLVWAFVGIAIKHPGVPVAAVSAGVAAGLVGLLAVISALPGGPLPLKR